MFKEEKNIENISTKQMLAKKPIAKLLPAL
jgi:hypothetical protein